jgi:hypothetical protein
MVGVEKQNQPEPEGFYTPQRIRHAARKNKIKRTDELLCQGRASSFRIELVWNNEEWNELYSALAIISEGAAKDLGSHMQRNRRRDCSVADIATKTPSSHRT